MYALITGASSGIGREMAILLAQMKYDLILVARRRERLEKLAAKLTERYSITVQVVDMDLSTPKAGQLLIRRTKKYPIEILINNAGFGTIGNLNETDQDIELQMIQTNVVTLHVLSKYFARTMKSGYILNVASIAAYSPIPLMATYGATKAYVRSFSLALRQELRKQKRPVSVTTLCPGPVTTEFNDVAGVEFSLRSITPKQCAKLALDGMFRGRAIVFPHPLTALAAIGCNLLPANLLVPIEYHMQHSKQEREESSSIK